MKNNTSECKIVKRNPETHMFNDMNYFKCKTHDRKIVTNREFDEINHCSKGADDYYE